MQRLATLVLLVAAALVAMAAPASAHGVGTIRSRVARAREQLADALRAAETSSDDEETG